MTESKTQDSGDTETLVVSPPNQQQLINIINNNIDSNKSPLEITITFKPVILLLTKDVIKQNIEHNIRKILYNSRFCARLNNPKVILLHEFSQTGLFHYHGIFYGIRKDLIGEIRQMLIRTFGRIEIKTIRYWDTYVKYMTKEREYEYKEYFKRNLDIFINIQK